MLILVSTNYPMDYIPTVINHNLIKRNYLTDKNVTVRSHFWATKIILRSVNTFINTVNSWNDNHTVTGYFNQQKYASDNNTVRNYF